MANIISNKNPNNSSHSNGGGGGEGLNIYTNNNSGNSGGGIDNMDASGNENAVSSIRDVCNFLQTSSMAMHQLHTPPGGCPYDHIIEMIRGLDIQDDGIVMNQKIKSIEKDFCNIVRDENMLFESMDYINDKALDDGDTALKFALLFSSRNFDSLAMKDTKVRSAMLNILENNFDNAQKNQFQNKDRLYNSITLLGEYYHRVRLRNNTPIAILGTSLLKLILGEISGCEPINKKLAKVILSQITLNGDIIRARHKSELTDLLFHIRRNLIEQPALRPETKALLLMTLDLYYNNFANLGTQLEEMYTRFLVQQHEDEGNNNNTTNNSTNNSYQLLPNLTEATAQSPPNQNYQSQILVQDLQMAPEQTAIHCSTDNSFNASHNNSYENGMADIMTNSDTYEEEAEERASSPLISTKTWREQMCEELEVDTNSEIKETTVVEAPIQQNVENDLPRNQGNSRRSYQHRNSPRPLKNHPEEHEGNYQPTSGITKNEDNQNDSKSLPRWRAPRFNRNNGDQQQQYGNNGRQRHPHRRFSASYDDDRHSVRSEGGSIRLYSINDRLKHAQEKMERSNSNQYNNIANSNWDRQSQRDDRSERSYISNYERGNHSRRGRHYNNQQNYDKPPRFQKYQQQQQYQHQLQNKHQQYPSKDNKIHSDSWRRSNNFKVEQQNDAESNSCSSSRAQTLPRPAKTNMDGSKLNPTMYRRSQSPNQSQYNHNNNNRKNDGNGRMYEHNNGRWGSQSSLTSKGSLSQGDRRHSQHKQNQRHRNFGRSNHSGSWAENYAKNEHEPLDRSDKDNENNELVRNARQTTKYMNYLSSK